MKTTTITNPVRLPILEANILITKYCDNKPIDLRSILITKELSEHYWKKTIELLRNAGLVKPNSPSIELINKNKNELKQKLTNYLINAKLVK